MKKNIDIKKEWKIELLGEEEVILKTPTRTYKFRIPGPKTRAYFVKEMQSLIDGS